MYVISKLEKGDKAVLSNKERTVESGCFGTHPLLMERISSSNDTRSRQLTSVTFEREKCYQSWG